MTIGGASSVVVSCTRVGINPVEYLTDVLHRVDRVTDAKLAELLPHRWEPPTKRSDPVDFDAETAAPSRTTREICRSGPCPYGYLAVPPRDECDAVYCLNSVAAFKRAKLSENFLTTPLDELRRVAATSCLTISAFERERFAYFSNAREAFFLKGSRASSSNSS